MMLPGSWVLGQTTTTSPPSTTLPPFVATADGPLRDVELAYLVCLILILVAVWIVVGRLMTQGRAV